MKPEWYWYLAGIMIVLAGKWALWIKHGVAMKKPFWANLWEWWELKSTESRISWFTTIGVEMIGGRIYIDHVAWDVLPSWLQSVPLDFSIAFTIGTLMELAAPEAAKRLLGRFTSQT